MKRLLTISLIILSLLTLLLLNINIASALTDAHGLSLSASGSVAGGQSSGTRILIKSNINIQNITKTANSGATYAILADDSGNTLIISNFTNDVANLSYNLLAGNYYRIVAKSDTAWTHRCLSSDPTLPISSTSINWTDGLFPEAATVQNYVYFCNIVSIDYTLNAATPSLLVNLTSPIDGSTRSASGSNFTANYTSVGYNFTNATYYIWNTTTTIFNQTTISITGNVTNSSTLFINNFFNAGNYSWNVKLCGVNNTGTLCTFAPINYSFFVGFQVNSVTFNNITSEGTNENFIINITYNSNVYSATALFNYDNTNYTTTLVGSGDNILFTRNLVIPSINLAQQNKSLYWLIGLTSGGITIYYPTNVYNQTIDKILIDNCASYTDRIMNMTLYDEDTRSILSGTIEAVVNIFGYNSNNVIANFNASYSGTNAQVCMKAGILNITNYTMAYQIKYYNGSNSNYFTEYIYGQNITLNNNTIPNIIPLYDLNTISTLGTSQAYNIIFRDSFLIPISNAIVSLQRQYIPINSFIQVEAPLTDSNGQVILHTISNNVVYKISVTQNGRLITTFDNQVFSCSASLCTITLNQIGSTTSIPDVKSDGGINYYFNNLSNQIQFNFNTIDGNPTAISWNVIKDDGYGNTTLCTNSLFTSIGTLSCTIPTQYTNNTIVASVYNNRNLVARQLFYFGPSTNDIFGGTRVVLGMLMYSTITLMFISNPIMIVIGAILGFIFAGAMFLVDGGTTLGNGSILLWFILSGCIIIWRISRGQV